MPASTAIQRHARGSRFHLSVTQVFEAKTGFELKGFLDSDPPGLRSE